MNKNLFGYFLLLFQPLFMASNLIVARGGIEYVPPISLSFWRWAIFFLILFLFNLNYLIKNFSTVKKSVLVPLLYEKPSLHLTPFIEEL